MTEKQKFEQAEAEQRRAYLFAQWCEKQLMDSADIGEYQEREKQLMDAEEQLDRAGAVLCMARAAYMATQIPAAQTAQQ